MEGEIGVLYQEGKQVAGVTNWEITLFLDNTSIKGWSSQKVTDKKISAWGYWLTQESECDEYEACFYVSWRGELVLVDKSIVKVNLPDAPLDKKMLCELEIIWLRHADEL